MKMSKSSLWILNSVAFVAVLAVGQRAHAFGGLWSTESGAIKQSSAQVILVDNPDSTVTAIVRIKYEGPSEQFAWIVPVPSTPTVGISSSLAFDRLDAATAPQYWVEETVDGACMGETGSDASTTTQDPPSEPDPAPTLTTDRGSVGPYDYATITVDSGVSDPAAAAAEWLASNGYASTGATEDALATYLKDGSKLLAFKLKPGADARDIRPIVLTYEGELPAIPIKLTAAAARADMDIQVWVVGPSHAVPDNYASLVINDARIDWTSARKFKRGTLPSDGVGPFGEYVSTPSNYAAVVTAAANEASGRGFVTELAAPASQFREKIWAPVDQEAFESISTQTYADGVDALLAASSNYGGWDGWTEVIAGAVTLPPGVTLDRIASNPDAYRGMVTVDVPTFFALLAALVIKPIADTATLLYNGPYLTRLYTTMSADEMTVDPAFDYNFDLAQVSSVHVARQQVECSSEIRHEDAPWRMQLPQGGVVAGEGSSWPVPDDMLPANLKVVTLSTRGSGTVVQDNTERIRENLKTTSSGTVVRPPLTGLLIGATQSVAPPPEASAPEPAAADSDDGCSVSPVGAATQGLKLPLWLTLAGLMLVALRRRRRGGLSVHDDRD